MNQRIEIKSDNTGWTVVDYGPMHLRIQALQGSRPQVQAAREAACQAAGYLDQVAALKTTLAQPASRLDTEPDNPIARRMLQSVRAVGDADLTPLAAVAGTLADAVADWLAGHGMTRVIVDNGGDIAVRLTDGESVTIGVRPDLRSTNLTHRLRLDSRFATWGITTSGYGGRSFTRGIASAVTAVGPDASSADACATAIANACWIDDERILQMPAETLDPNTDLYGIPVTVTAGPLEPAQYRRAIQRALEKAHRLVEQEVIYGALIAAGGTYAMTDFLAALCQGQPVE